MTNRPHIFYELTNSICAECYVKVEAKVIIEGQNVYLLKHCPEHKQQKVLISTDADYYRKSREFLKPGQLPLKFNTPTRFGCPYDCGLCPDHEQHSCLTLLEVTDHCNLECPICYAESSPKRKTYKTLREIEFLLDAIVSNEGEPDIVQISGGEPTTHPDFFAILDAAKARPIKHLMINTNGIRIAKDLEFSRRLSEYKPGLEVYLQFDSLRENVLQELRGANLHEVRLRALANLNKFNISTTLVAVLKKGLNDDEAGAILDFALEQPCVRGITFQPIQDAGRVEGFDPARDRLTLGEIRQNILRQSTVFKPADLIPVPCHPDCLMMGYALKLDGKVVPLTSMIDPEELLKTEKSTIVFEREPSLKDHIFSLFSTAHSPTSSASCLKDLLCCLPQVEATPEIGYDNLFRVLVVQFLDAHNFDVRSVKRSCIHIAAPDGKIIPFDTYNLFYRDDKRKILERLRKKYDPSPHVALKAEEIHVQ